ncbi:hypothetical protein F2Q70_00034301 [Brassica cretica]|uniref:Cystatin domain-containing protein n=1 Tax=Brassica cretica TaxID=69181 RepID=A0A8S9JZK9_BRACR|nr:hypothetical protein F2Q70_00034301 [Brassica cretica]
MTEKGTNFKFVRWEKFSVISTAYDYVYVTLDAKDPVSDSVFSFQTLLNEDSSSDCPVMWSTLACRIKCDDRVDDHWDDTAVDDFYKGAMPKWLSDEELARDNKKYYVVLTAPPPLEIENVVVVTKEDTDEGHEKLKAQNSIYYVIYKYNGESSEWARDHKAIIRKTMDGKPGHMYLEVVAED